MIKLKKVITRAKKKKIKKATDPSIIGVCGFFDVLFLKKK